MCTKQITESGVRCGVVVPNALGSPLGAAHGYFSAVAGAHLRAAYASGWDPSLCGPHAVRWSRLALERPNTSAGPAGARGTQQTEATGQ
eukprot:scaffold1411_cov125-Isochrysis_galbana.AAC.17